jgi:hypothetical protein
MELDVIRGGRKLKLPLRLNGSDKHCDNDYFDSATLSSSSGEATSARLTLLVTIASQNRLS